MDKMFTDLTSAVSLSKDDLFAVEQSDGTKKATFELLSDQTYVTNIVEQTSEFPDIEAEDSLKVVAGKVKKWQKDALEEIGKCISQSKIIQEFPQEEKEELKNQVISALLAYTMNEKILKLITDHDELVADYEVMKRDQLCSIGYFGAEWDIDDLMALVKAEQWDKFAHGDYFVEETSTGEKIQYEVAGKNSYLHCGDSIILESPHIVCCPRDTLETRYKYNDTNTNTGGYAASLMPDSLETEANKFSSKLQGYMTTIERRENNKDAWAWASRRIFLPSNPEVIGNLGFTNGYAGGGFNQLRLFSGGNAHILKGRGFEKSIADRSNWWTADPSSLNTTTFCGFYNYGCSTYYNADGEYSVAPLIVLS